MTGVIYPAVLDSDSCYKDYSGSANDYTVDAVAATLENNESEFGTTNISGYSTSSMTIETYEHDHGRLGARD